MSSVLPVTQPTVSKHWMERTQLTTTSENQPQNLILSSYNHSTPGRLDIMQFTPALRCRLSNLCRNFLTDKHHKNTWSRCGLAITAMDFQPRFHSNEDSHNTSQYQCNQMLEMSYYTMSNCDVKLSSLTHPRFLQVSRAVMATSNSNRSTALNGAWSYVERDSEPSVTDLSAWRLPVHGTVFQPVSLQQLLWLPSKTTKNISFHKVVPGILVCVPCPRSTFAHATLICMFLTN